MKLKSIKSMKKNTRRRTEYCKCGPILRRLNSSLPLLGHCLRKFCISYCSHIHSHAGGDASSSASTSQSIEADGETRGEVEEAVMRDISTSSTTASRDASRSEEESLSEPSDVDSFDSSNMSGSLVDSDDDF